MEVMSKGGECGTDAITGVTAGSVTNAHTPALPYESGSGLPASVAPRLALAQAAQMVAQQATLQAGMDHFALVAVLGVAGMLVAATQRIFR